MYFCIFISLTESPLLVFLYVTGMKTAGTEGPKCCQNLCSIYSNEAVLKETEFICVVLQQDLMNPWHESVEGLRTMQSLTPITGPLPTLSADTGS